MIRIAIIALLFSELPLLAATLPAPDFLREVRPILSTHCFNCHGPDEKTRKGGLRLDLREGAIGDTDSGTPAITPGKPEKSELITRIYTTDRDDLMPPPSSKHELTAAQKDTLRRWIVAGADYQPHWAFIAPKQTPPPADGHPIDAFIHERLAQEKLTPSPEADRLTLARRVALDLIGLPPTPEEADAFLNDDAPDAYERYVDRLLASPHYGERWARKWLDLARYADTNGYEKDRPRTIWPYRDWVIRALNEDMPFDAFTIKQLAGDLLPGATEDDRIATGFHRNTMLNEEGGIDPLEFRFHAMTDRVGTTGTTWLGLTVACAQCHTHKYDPILHTEYYGLMAFLNNTDEPDLELKTEERAKLAKANQEKAETLLAKLGDAWPVDETVWHTPQIQARSESATARVLEDGSALFPAGGSERDTYTFEFETGETPVDRLRLEALTDPSLPKNGPGLAKNGNFVISEIIITAQAKTGGESLTVRIASGESETQQTNFPLSAAWDGKTDTGWGVDKGDGTLNTAKSAVFRFEKPVSMPGGTRWKMQWKQAYGSRHLVGRPRISLGHTLDKQQLAAARSEAREAAFARWLERQRSQHVAWAPLKAVKATSNLPLLTIEPDGSIFASGDISKDDRYEVHYASVPAGTTAIRLEVLPDSRLPGHGPGLTYYEGPKGDFFLGEIEVLAAGQPLKIARASESYAKNHFGDKKVSAALAVDGDPQTGWSCADRFGERHEAVFVFAEPLKQASDLVVKMQFGRHYAASLGRFRIAGTSDPRGGEASGMEPEVAPLLDREPSTWTAQQRRQVMQQFLLNAPLLKKEAAKIRELQKPPSLLTTLVMSERPANHPRPTFLHHRGEFLQPKERIEPHVPAFLPPLPPGEKRDRLSLARWLVSQEQPLTPRVVVNRHWAAFFGTGLVKTQNDFGFQGEPPSHPALLDWLAVEFVKQGWSVKKLHRLIVTSATYRQVSRVTPELLTRDPENRLLARGPRFRVEAEMVRDTALRASGLLVPTLFGPPVKPPQPAGATEIAYGNQSWNADTGPNRYRRALYTFQKRSAPYAMFGTFDAPSGEVCVANREKSNTPLQALTLLNDDVILEAARVLGTLAVAAGRTDAERAALLFRRCATRNPDAEELNLLTTFAAQQRERLGRGELDSAKLTANPKGEKEAAIWTTVARAILNLDETITKN